MASSTNNAFTRRIRLESIVINREPVAIGGFLTLEASIVHTQKSGVCDYPRIQSLTIKELLAGKQIEMPQSGIPIKQAIKINGSEDQRVLVLK